MILTPHVSMKNKKTIFVTGAGGQLGSELQEISRKNTETEYRCIFSEVSGDYTILDITNGQAGEKFFRNNVVDVCINTAAYTAVDAAETNEILARKVNVDGARNLARACQKHGALFLHISTDFVFDGTQSMPYTEEDVPHPLNIYAQTKLKK